MKTQIQKIKLLILLMAITPFCSCQYNQSINKDLITGAHSRGDGIGVDNVEIEINSNTDNRNEFVFGEKVNLIFNNVSGLNYSDGKTYPELSMHIVKNEIDTVFSNPNLLNNLKNGTELSPLQLHANFVAALPFKNDEKYKVKVEITDKKGEGRFNYELPFTVKKNDLLDIEGNGIEYSTIYLWNDTLKQALFTNNVSTEHIIILILNEIEGLETIEEKVYPIFSLDLIDNDGNILISNPNLLSSHEEQGIDPNDLRTQVTAKLTFTNGIINNPCKLTAKFKDKNSSKELNITTELNIN